MPCATPCVLTVTTPLYKVYVCVNPVSVGVWKIHKVKSSVQHGPWDATLFNTYNILKRMSNGRVHASNTVRTRFTAQKGSVGVMLMSGAGEGREKRVEVGRGGAAGRRAKKALST